ncbi:hypothetical protein COP2_022179 [Malus domestica]
MSGAIAPQISSEVYVVFKLFILDQNNGIYFILQEVFVPKERSTGKGECLSLVKDPIMYKNTWRIDNVSKLDAESYDSKTFIAGDQKWKMQLYTKGKDNGVGTHLAFYLALAKPNLFLLAVKYMQSLHYGS